MKKKLICLLLTAAMAFTFCSCGDDAQSEDKDTEKEYKVAMEGSPWINSNIYEGLDREYRPTEKEDFYINTNREWFNNAKPWEGEGYNLALEQNKFEVEENITTLLDSKAQDSHEGQLIRTFYKLYMDWDGRDAAGVQPLEDQLDRINSISSMEELDEYVTSEETDAIGCMPIKMTVDESPIEEGKYAICVDGADLLLSDAAEYKKLSDSGKLEKENVEKEAVYLLEQTKYKDDAQDFFDDCYAYEKKIAESYLSDEDASELTKLELLITAPNYPMTLTLEMKGFEEEDSFVAVNSEALRKISEVYTEENLDKIKAALMVHQALNMKYMLTEEITTAVQEMDSEAAGSEKALKDKQLAAVAVKEYLSAPLAKAYSEEYFSEDMKEDIGKITGEVINYYKGMLKLETWLDKDTRAKAREKLDSIDVFAVYPEEWRDYSGLELTKADDGGSYVEAVEAINKFEADYARSCIGEKVDEELWESCTDADAYYDPKTNNMYICGGLLGEGIYMTDMKDEEKYAAIGSIIAREISHAFDAVGAKYDKDGNSEDWWTEEDHDKYQKKARRLAKYYNEITVLKGEKCDGDRVKNEAIADMAGMKAILGIASEKDEFDYDRFFRTYAHMWACVETRDLAAERAASESEPFEYLRCNLTLMQFDKFCETYNIKEGDPMYLAPESRINVW